MRGRKFRRPILLSILTAVLFSPPVFSATIVIDADEVIGPINRLMFGNAQPYGHGDLLFQSDTWDFDPQALHMVSNLGSTVLRFPGGLRANEYFWEDGIGPHDLRPAPRRGQYQPRSFHYGTDEHLALCQAIGAEAFFTVNYGSGLAGDSLSTDVPLSQRVNRAAAWVEYCNTPNDGSNPNGGVDWAARRAANGHPKPYGVTYWEIGNEIYGETAIGRPDDVEEYARDLIDFSRAMKSIDPDIRIGAVGAVIAHWHQWWNDSPHEWNTRLLQIAHEDIDFLVVHCHYPGITEVTGEDLYRAGMASANQARLDLEELRAVIDEQGSSSIKIVAGENAFFAGVDQWDLNTTLLAGLHYADLSMMFLQNCENLGIELACGWTLASNTPSGDIACRYSPFRRFANPEYYAQLAFGGHFGQVLVSHSVVCGTFSTTEVCKVKPRSDIPELAVCASLDSAGQKLYMMAINRQIHEDVESTIEIRNFRPASVVKLWTLNSPDILANNEEQANTVYLSPATMEKADSTFCYVFAAHSLTVMEFERSEEEEIVPPVISDLVVERIDGTSARVSWRTDKPADSAVEFGTVAGHYPFRVEEPTLCIDHHIVLETLSSQTGYFYRAISRDQSGQQTSSPEEQFWTLDITPPAINELEVEAITESSAVISWQTDEPADAMVRYGTESSLEEMVTDGALATEHNIDLVSLEAATTYRFQVCSADAAGNVSGTCEDFFTTASPRSGIEEARQDGTPASYQLYQNYPNPFNGSTTVRYRLPTAGQVTVKVFNALGQTVMTLLEDYQQPGDYQLFWDATDERGEEVASGIYFCCLQVENVRHLCKMTLLR